MTNIELLKQKLEIKTSEELFGITEQPIHQCPKIDDIIGELERTRKNIEWRSKYIQKMEDISDIHSMANDIEWYSDDIYKIKELNELRSQIDLIRGWGEEWKNIAKSLLNKITNEDDLVHYLSNNCQIKYDSIAETKTT